MSPVKGPVSVRKRRNLRDSEDSSDEEFMNRLTDFKRGSVVRLKLRNFMTYTSVDFEAGPYLNLVVAPNGTGKSALICGLIIGLAGEVSLTGRAASMAEYVKMGTDVALTEIELYNDRGRNFVIRRKITKGTELASGRCHCTTEWMLNGHNATLSEVRLFTKSLSISVDNLCQFLPQEKVQEFAKMGPKDLLENTEKAYGDESLIKRHQKLIELSRTFKEDQKQKKILEDKTKTVENMNQRTEQEVARIQEKKEVMKKITILKVKKPWIVYDLKRKEYVERSEVLKKLREKKKKADSLIEPYKKTVENIQKEVSKFEIDLKTKKQSVKNKIVRQKTLVKDILTETENGNTLLDTFASEKNAFEKRLEDIRKIENEINDTRIGLEQKRSEQELTGLIEETESEMEEGLSKKRELDNKKDTQQFKTREVQGKIESCEERIRQMDILHLREKRLREQNMAALKGLQLLNQLKAQGKFKQTIFPPIMMLINVKELAFADFVENCIPRRDLFSFVCQDSEDMTLFSRELGMNNIRVALVMAPSGRQSYQTDSNFLRRLKQFGFLRYISDMFDAPGPVKDYLCNQFKLHCIPVGGDDVSSNLSAIQTMSQGKLNVFFSRSMRYNQATSRYDGKTITSQDYLRKANLLTIISDTDRLEQQKEILEGLKEQLNTVNLSIKEIDDQLNQIQETQKPLQQKKRTLKGELDEVVTAKKRIQLKETELKKKQNFKYDKEAEEKLMKQKMADSVRKVLILMKEAASVSMEVVSLTELTFAASVAVDCGRKRLRDATTALKKAKDTQVSLIQQVNDTEELVESTKAAAKRLREKALDILKENKYQPVNNNIPEDLKRIFDKYPDDLDDLLARINTLEAKLQGMVVGLNDRAEEEYDQRKQEIKENKRLIDQLTLKIDSTGIEIDNVREQWLPPLNAMIHTINSNFSASMKALGYSGEVSLKGEGINYNEYGIVIKVKYRDSEDLQALTACTQSGGEKSVATIIYMMALQQLTKVPFRAVDEINQGMDSTNERKIFNLIVSTAVNNSSQYFLLSPKLLLGLQYTDKMTIHNIFNGPDLRDGFLNHL